MDYICINCKKNIDLKFTGKEKCSVCGELYETSKNYLKTYPDSLLFRDYKKRYLENKVLNNNAILSYQFLPEGSISLESRKDVQRFSLFLSENTRGNNVLDLGCGIMQMPGYFASLKSKDYKFYGLDPLDSTDFFGTRIVGASEYLPFANSTIENVIYATSLDHVVDIDASLKETSRVLTSNGRVMLWISDRSKTIKERLRNFLATTCASFRKGYNINKYFVYDNYTVLGVPRGAVDPFHSFNESPKIIEKYFKRNKFTLINKKVFSKNEIFYTFEKNSSI
jgi:ubiquinone/menaquinone biosynthesis C-methylase UbiE